MIKKNLKTIFPIWLAVLFLVVILLRLPSLFEPFSYGDECVYLTLGEALKKGLVFYRDIHDNKPPLLYLLAAVAGNVFWFRFLLLISSLAMIHLFFRLLHYLFPNVQKMVLISTVTFGVLSSLPLTEGNIANAEVFMVLPTIAGILRLFCGKSSMKTYFLAGIFFSLATLFKVPAAFDFVAVVFFLVFFQPPTKNLRLLFSYLLSLIAGFSLPILATFIYYFFQGAFSQYLTAAFLQNFGYLSSWRGKSAGLPVSSGLLLRGVFLVFLSGILWFRRKKISPWFSLILLWFAFSLFAATLSERPYPHYLFQVLPSACIILGGLVSRVRTGEKSFFFGFLILLAMAIGYFGFWHYATLGYYKNFLSYALKQKSYKDYLSYFGATRNYEIADFIVHHTGKNEKVFIWGDSPCIYALSRRLPVGRYTAAYHVLDFDRGFEQTLSALEKEKPLFIINLQTEKRSFLGLNLLLQKNYSLYETIEEAEIFVRIHPK